MKLLPLSWSFILILFITSCSSNDDSPAAATRANISGSVNLYNESTNLVDLSNMTVSVLGTMPLNSAVTDAQGKFVLSNVPFGTYTLEYTKNGYGTYKKFGVVHGTNGQATALIATPSPLLRESFRVVNVIKYERDARTSLGNGKKCAKFTFFFRNNFYLSGK
jgi:hypothetical protein